jgi:hypothetical protein
MDDCRTGKVSRFSKLAVTQALNYDSEVRLLYLIPTHLSSWQFTKLFETVYAGTTCRGA